MATTNTTTPSAVQKDAKTKVIKAPVSLTERMKTQLNAAALRGRVTVDDLSDLEQHIRKIAAFVQA